jgi:uncharacterized phage protein (TIGR02218 family)
MTRPLAGGLAAAAAQSAAFWSECLVLVARDGTTVGFTALDEVVTVDLTGAPDFTGGAVECSEGMTLSAITLAVGLDASFAEVEGALGPVVTEAAVNGGKWDDALAWLVRVCPGVAGYVPILAGKVREPRVEDAKFVFEIRNHADELNQPVGEAVTSYCKTTFQSAQCGVTVAPLAATITGVTDALRLTVSYSGTFADDHFNFGKIVFTSGELAGVTSDNLFDFASGGAGVGSLVLFEPLPALPAIGDALDLSVGCARIRKSDDPAVPTCLSYDNVVNFRAEPDVPGTDQVLRYPNPGA